MTPEHDADERRPALPLDGLPLDDAVARVLAREGGDGSDAPDDRAAVRAALDHVAEDGVVRRAAFDDAVAHASKVVSTPETRVELAGIALDDARETARPVTDLDAVRSRLESLDARLDALQERTDALGADLSRVVERTDDPADLYAVAEDIRRLTDEANRVQVAADDLSLDAEAFERWVGSPAVRAREFADDVDAVGAALDNLSDAVDDLPDADGLGDEDAAAAGLAWADASMRHRLLGLLLADLRAELSDLRALDGSADGASGTDHGERLDDLADHLDDLAARRDALGDRLADRTRPAWRARHGDRVAAFEDALAAFDPPVDWGEVQATLDEHRAALGPDE